jgi:hypothetical protein
MRWCNRHQYQLEYLIAISSSEGGDWPRWVCSLFDQKWVEIEQFS